MTGPHIDAVPALVYLYGVAIGAAALKVTQLEARIRCSRCGKKLQRLRETTECHESCAGKCRQEGSNNVWK